MHRCTTDAHATTVGHATNPCVVAALVLMSCWFSCELDRVIQDGVVSSEMSHDGPREGLRMTWKAQQEQKDPRMITENDVVQSILSGGDDEAIGILFQRHAAIYFLDRGNPKFEEWLLLLKKSESEGKRVRFAYTLEGQRLTLVEEVD